ncbi:MAG: enoyl-CoA hydratase-related protein, partial [Candidatus Adiutricales bacterium]
MAFEHITVEQKDHVTIVTMNRPEVMNAISPVTSGEMAEAINAFDGDPNAWICIVTGAGERA